MKRFNIVNNGYDPEEVNKFIDVVIKRLEKLNEENNYYLKLVDELKKQTKVQTEYESKVDETKLAEALLAAQDTSIKMKELAKKEAEMLIEEAKKNANAIIHEALLEAQKYEQESAVLKKNITVYKNRIKSLLETQLQITDDMDKIEL